MSTVIIASATILVVLSIGMVASKLRQPAPKAPSPPAQPPHPPTRIQCPACNSEEVRVLMSGNWDGLDSAGHGTGGTLEIGLCEHCGVRCERRSVRDNDTQQNRFETRILSDAEWQKWLTKFSR